MAFSLRREPGWEIVQLHSSEEIKLVEISPCGFQDGFRLGARRFPNAFRPRTWYLLAIYVTACSLYDRPKCEGADSKLVLQPLPINGEQGTRCVGLRTAAMHS